MSEGSIELKRSTILQVGDDIKLTVQFAGFQTHEAAKKFLDRLQELADELSGQTKLA
jgi:hypothetical protein